MQLPGEVIAAVSSQFGISDSREEVFKETLAAIINKLINSDFTRLVQILYRLDISERKLAQMLDANPSDDAGNIIAALVIEREVQKAQSRQQFRRNTNIPDDESW